MAPDGVRRSSRVSREIPILLFGSDTEGRTFSEETKTVVLSRHGAGILSNYKLSAEQEIFIRRLDSNTEAEFRVVGQIGFYGGSYTYGVSFVGFSADFWEIAFPAPTASELEATRVILECSKCEAKEVVQQSDMEADVFLVNEGIVRYCKNCGSSTFWKRAPEGTVVDPAPSQSVLPVPPSPSPAGHPIPSSGEKTAISAGPAEPPAKMANRRKYMRTKVRFQACIRSFEYGDDVVACEDMSRGGIRFTTRQKYVAGTEIQVAVPYSAGSPGIFVAGQIVRVVEHATDKTFQCGLQFLGTDRK
jgi:hypothetical protein